MRNLLLGALIGLTAGYCWGYDEGEVGKPTIAERALDRFGVSKVKEAQDARERKQQDAIGR
jgi:hypothetical protein